MTIALFYRICIFIVAASLLFIGMAGIITKKMPSKSGVLRGDQAVLTGCFFILLGVIFSFCYFRRF